MNIKSELQNQIEEALYYSASKISYIWVDKELNVFKELNIDFKYRFLVTMHTNLIRQCPFFNTFMNPNFVVRIVPLLKPIQFGASQTVYEKNSFSDGILFLVSGKVYFYCTVFAYVENQDNNDYKIKRKRFEYSSEPPINKKTTNFDDELLTNRILKKRKYISDIIKLKDAVRY